MRAKVEYENKSKEKKAKFKSKGKCGLTKKNQDGSQTAERKFLKHYDEAKAKKNHRKL
jgi:hypothetical protein